MTTLQHIAIIMDGNGRWAKQRGLNRIDGHKAGQSAVRTVITSAINANIKYITLYSFSEENWHRPADEVNSLMILLTAALKNEVDWLNKNNIQLRVIGTLYKFSDEAQSAIQNAVIATMNNTGLILVLALSYGGRQEIIDATKKISQKIYNNQLTIDDISENILSDNLYDQSVPDPDMIIRTGGDLRLSNFLLWQAAYSELVFFDVFWPDFSADNFLDAISQFNNRIRRYGRVIE